MLKSIQTSSAPESIGSYSQAVQFSNLVFLSGQIPLDPKTMQLVEGEMSLQVQRVFENLKEVAIAAGGSLQNVVRLTVYLLDLTHIKVVNEVMKIYFNNSFPARTAIGVTSLPKSAQIEIDAIMALNTAGSL